uniref:Uncharacterized protein n=1 Tax=Biomphalaria glabrata TaxID=6526 RepID=A0A2C9KPR1_BIOGL
MIVTELLYAGDCVLLAHIENKFQLVVHEFAEAAASFDLSINPKKNNGDTIVTKRTEHAQFFKVIIIGPENVGKTCFLQRFATKSFTETYLATIGVDFSVSTIQSADGQPIKLQVWDTAGQERFRTITNSYFRGAHGIIVMYDVQNKDTFQQLPYWLDTVERFASSERSL